MAPVPPQSPKEFRSLLRVYHKDKQGALKSLQKFDLSERIHDAISSGERSISTSLFSQRDMKELKQMGLQTKTENEVVDLVVDLQWDVKSFVNIVAKAPNDTHLRRQVLAMAVDCIRKTAHLDKILTMKLLPPYAIRENPYLGPGHVPYENFIDSLLEVTDTSTTSGKELFERFLESVADDADKAALTCVDNLGLRTVFHGTDHGVIDAILKSGLDPNCRLYGWTKDFFGIDYETSLIYSDHEEDVPTNPKLLVFLVIGDPHEDNVGLSGALTIESNKLELPLAEITMTDIFQ
ncbi:unnamed protein product [Calypogeia fissa]